MFLSFINRLAMHGLFGSQKITVTLANWRKIVKPAFITSQNI
jgi:hypothetical protein